MNHLEMVEPGRESRGFISAQGNFAGVPEAEFLEAFEFRLSIVY